MTIQLQTPREAFAAVAWLICSADKSGSTAEMQFLYAQVQHLEIFGDCNAVEFQNLIGATFSKLFHTLPNGELSIQEQDVENLVREIHDLLSPELRTEAYRMAGALAAVDTVCVAEEEMLERLQQGLGIGTVVT